MERCPKHSEHIQSGDTCMEWVCRNKWVDNFRCGCALDSLSSNEMRAIQEKHTQETIAKTTLPSWVMSAIKSIAYEKFHSYGQTEVDGCISEWIYVFERERDAHSSV